MFIRDVDEALEAMLRARLPMPEEVGDIAFDAPTDGWSARLSRLTVDLFLYSVDRSSAPNRSANVRVDEVTGKAQRRAPQPMIDLSYVVSAWAGNPTDEHQLLSDVVSIFAGSSALPAEYVSERINSSITLSIAADPTTRPRDVWQAIGGKLKACLLLKVTVAADSFAWEDQAPAVERISVLSSPEPFSPGA